MKQKAPTVTKSELNKILNKYRQLGTVKGGDLCLSPDDSLRLVDELENLGVSILGADGWYFASPEHEGKGFLSQDLDVDLYVGDEVLKGSNPAHERSDIVRKFLRYDLPERTRFVSLTLNVPGDWDYFPTPGTGIITSRNSD